MKSELKDGWVLDFYLWMREDNDRSKRIFAL